MHRATGRQTIRSMVASPAGADSSAGGTRTRASTHERARVPTCMAGESGRPAGSAHGPVTVTLVIVTRTVTGVAGVAYHCDMCYTERTTEQDRVSRGYRMARDMHYHPSSAYRAATSARTARSTTTPVTRYPSQSAWPSLLNLPEQCASPRGNARRADRVLSHELRLPCLDRGQGTSCAHEGGKRTGRKPGFWVSHYD